VVTDYEIARGFSSGPEPGMTKMIRCISPNRRIGLCRTSSAVSGCSFRQPLPAPPCAQKLGRAASVRCGIALVLSGSRLSVANE